MEKCHPDLIRLVEHVIVRARHDFSVREQSVRTIQDQANFVAQGWSTTMNSRHVPENNACGLSCAVDVAVYDNNGSITNKEYYYKRVAQDFITSAIKLGIPINCGALFGSFFDGGHFEIPYNVEPSVYHKR